MNNLTAKPIVLQGQEIAAHNLAFSPDGHWLADISPDGTARLWNMQDPTEKPITLQRGEDYALALAFSPDGRWLATSSSDHTVRLWHLRLEELLSIACQVAGRNFTFAEWKQYFPGEEYRITCPQWPAGN